MKTIFTCEICGKEFSDFEQCLLHEKVCKEDHATGIRLTADLSSILRQAEAAGIPILTGRRDPIYLEAVEYEAEKKRIHLQFTD